MIALSRLPPKRWLPLLFVRLIAMVMAAFVLMCDRGGFLVKHVFYRMDTVIEVTVVLTKKDSARQTALWQRIEAFLEEWEQRFSQTGPESEVLRINQRIASRMPVSGDLAGMIDLSTRYGDTLSGGFDLTIFPIKLLWGLGERDTALTVPDPRTLDSALNHVSYKKIRLNVSRDTVIIDDPHTMIDAGGIAKGEALCRVSRLLSDAGFESFLVNGGGDIVSRGAKPDGRPWFIGVQHPRNRERLLAALRLDSGTVYTSGDYERFYLRDGKRYHHIFDPKTGYSATGNQSVTIWDMDPREAKMFSTGLFNRPAKEIVAFIEQRPRAECIVVDSAGAVFVSNGWKNRIEWR
jgi:thiamine biosynthesis lipoprotein